MNTYTQILYQIVFGTRNRQPTLTRGHRDQLYNYIVGILVAKKCHPYRINGIEDHIHILTYLHPSVALSSLVKDIKMASTDYIKREGLFKHFRGWQAGFGAFTYHIRDKDRLIDYIKNQEIHHGRRNFASEYTELLLEHDVDYDERYIL